MKKGVKKAVKITAISIGSLAALILGAIALTVNYIVTPEKVTPVVNKVASQYIDADVEIGRVDFTFFSSFPHFSVVIDSLAITPSWTPEPFVRLNRAEISVSPLLYLSGGKVRVSRVKLDDPNIYMYVDTLGRSVLSIFRTSDNEADTSRIELDMAVKMLAIDRGRVVVDDRSNSFYASTDSIDIKLAGIVSERFSAVKAKVDFRDLLAWQSGRLLMSRLSLDINSQIRYNHDSLRLDIDTARFHFGGMAFGAAGSLRGDTTARRVAVDVGIGIKAISFAEILSMVPSDILKKDVGVTSDGAALFIARLNGYYGKDELPTVDARLTVSDASLHYDKMPVGIDRLDADIRAFVDPMKRTESHARIERFELSSGPAGIKLRADAANLLGDPAVNFDIESDIDLTDLSSMLPLSEGMVLKGSNNTTMKGRFRLSDLQYKDYGAIWLDGVSRFNDVTIAYDSHRTPTPDSSYFYAIMRDGEFNFGSSVDKGKLAPDTSNLTAHVFLNGLGFRARNGTRINLAGINLRADSRRSKDTSTLSTLFAEIDVARLDAHITDTLDGSLKSSRVSLKMEPAAPHTRRPMFTGTINTDSLNASSKLTNAYVSLYKSGFKLTATAPEQRGGRNWHLKGGVGFTGFEFYSDIFPLVVKMPVTTANIDGSRITLKRARMVIGSSDVTVTGWIDNMLKVMFGDKRSRIEGNVSVASKNINANELLAALDAAAEYDQRVEAELAAADGDRTAVNITQPSAGENTVSAEDIVEGRIEAPAAKAATDTTLTVFMIPQGVKMDLDLDVDTIRISDLTFTDIIGSATINRGALRLNDFDVQGLGAVMHAEMYYRANNRRGAYLKAYLVAHQIDISQISKLIPSLVEATPMIKDLEGTVDMSAAIIGNLNKDMTVKMPSLQGLVTLNGQELVLLDTETFAKISKMLLFKNKKRNMIDTLAVSLLAREGRIDVPPFEIEIDRYRAIIGGTQTVSTDFDIDFKYNISVLKSPIPFKLGIDIFGNTDDFDFKITKAKLKRSDFGEIDHNLDSIRTALITEIRRDNAARPGRREQYVRSATSSGSTVSLPLETDGAGEKPEHTATPARPAAGHDHNHEHDERYEQLHRLIQ